MSDTELEDEAPTSKKIETKRIFINHIDTFNGKNLAKHLSKCAVGASSGGEEEEAGEEEGEGGETKEKNTYQIYGTVKNTDDFKGAVYVKEIVKVRFGPTCLGIIIIVSFFL